MHSLLRSKRVAAATAVGIGLALSLGMVPGADAVGSASPAAPIKVIQNSAETVSPGMVACGNATNTAENHYYRRFDLSGAHNAAQGFKVSSVVFGVEAAMSGDNTIPGAVLVWAI